MTLKEYKALKIGDKVESTVPVECNSGAVTLPAGTTFTVAIQTARVRQSKGMPWFFWNCTHEGHPTHVLFNFTKPEMISKKT